MAFNVSASAWESDVNVNNNTSIAHVKITITTSGKSYSNYDHYGTIVIDGTSYSHGAYRLPQNTTRTFESTKTITHNDDGSKSINWSYSFPVKSDDTRTGSGSLTLTTIARASQPSVSSSSVNLGSQITINTNRASGNFTHTITYSIGSLSNQTSGLGASTGVGVSTTFTPPADLAKQFPNATSGTVTITCKTYNGSTLLGTKTCTVTVKTIDNSTYKPTMSLSVAPSGQFKSKYLNKVSGVTVSATTGGKYNATISSYSISGLSKTASKANLVVNPINENITNASQSFTISGSVTDSRGYTNTASTSITVYRYNAPQITQYSVQRCTSDGTVSNSGTYAKVGITYKYQNDGYSNTMPTKKININNTDYNLTTTETTSNGVVTGTGYTVVGGGNLAITNKYNYTITCIDEVGKSITSQGVLNTSERIVSIRPRGKGIAFGMFATTDNLVESAWKIKSTNGFEGNASTATKATNTQVDTTNPSSQTTYYPTFVSGNGEQRQRINNGILHISKEGTASALGEAYFRVGNGTASGTAGNKKGFLQLYGQNTGRSQIEYANSTSNATHTLPAHTGNIEVWKNLYNNTSGTTGNITLSETCANFTFIDIYYGKGGLGAYTRIYSPNGKTACLNYLFRSDNLFQFQTAQLTFNGTTITKGQYGGINVNLNATTLQTFTSNELSIFRVDGVV